MRICSRPWHRLWRTATAPRPHRDQRLHESTAQRSPDAGWRHTLVIVLWRILIGVGIGLVIAWLALVGFLLIDMQNDFLLPDAPVWTPGGLDLIPRIAALAAGCREAGYPVVFTQEMHRADLSDFGIELAFEPPHCLEGTAGMDIVAGLE